MAPPTLMVTTPGMWAGGQALCSRPFAVDASRRFEAPRSCDEFGSASDS